MLAVFTIVGHLLSETQTDPSEGCFITVETERAFRRMDGTLENNRFRVRVWKGIAMECQAVLPGTVITVRGRVESDGQGQAVLIGEKVSFDRGLFSAVQ